MDISIEQLILLVKNFLENSQDRPKQQDPLPCPSVNTSTYVLCLPHNVNSGAIDKTFIYNHYLRSSPLYLNRYSNISFTRNYYLNLDKQLLTEQFDENDEIEHKIQQSHSIQVENKKFYIIELENALLQLNRSLTYFPLNELDPLLKQFHRNIEINSRILHLIDNELFVDLQNDINSFNNSYYIQFNLLHSTSTYVKQSTQRFYSKFIKRYELQTNECCQDEKRQKIFFALIFFYSFNIFEKVNSAINIISTKHYKEIRRQLTMNWNEENVERNFFKETTLEQFIPYLMSFKFWEEFPINSKQYRTPFHIIDHLQTVITEIMSNIEKVTTTELVTSAEAISILSYVLYRRCKEENPFRLSNFIHFYLWTFDNFSSSLNSYYATTLLAATQFLRQQLRKDLFN
ncbi:hypothetical protein SNEBB_001766 [Seison nebaliae]|nr:hypothetical protein SNEBB_001766 [Seison nebaliae]